MWIENFVSAENPNGKLSLMVKTHNENSVSVFCVAHEYNIRFFAQSLFGSSNSYIICLGQKEQKQAVKECKPRWVAVFYRYYESFISLDLSMSGGDL